MLFFHYLKKRPKILAPRVLKKLAYAFRKFFLRFLKRMFGNFYEKKLSKNLIENT